MPIKVTCKNSDIYIFDEQTVKLIECSASDTETQIRKLLPSLSAELTLTVLPSQNVIPELGRAGYALSSNAVEFKFDPNSKLGTETVLTEGLKSALYHELHHAARMKTVKWGGNLLERAIFEGLAIVFERENCGSNPPFGRYDSQSIGEWTIELIDNKDTGSKQDWFFDHPDGRKWIGYRVGTYIVDQAISNSQETSATLVDASADEVLQLSGLNEQAQNSL